jgi:hypothetical protein
MVKSKYILGEILWELQKLTSYTQSGTHRKNPHPQGGDSTDKGGLGGFKMMLLIALPQTGEGIESKFNNTEFGCYTKSGV